MELLGRVVLNEAKLATGSSGSVPLDPGVILQVLLEHLWRPGIKLASNRVPLWVMNTPKLTTGSSGSVPLDPGVILQVLLEQFWRPDINFFLKSDAFVGHGHSQIDHRIKWQRAT